MLQAANAPDRELSELQPRLEGAFRAAARRLRTRLMSRSGADTPVRAVDLRTQVLAELSETPELTQAALWCAFSVDRTGGGGLLVLDGALLDGLIGRLFGGAEVPMGEPYQPRPLTDVEVRIGDRLFDEVLGAISACWPAQPGPSFHDRVTAVTRPGSLGATTMLLVLGLEFGSEAEPLGRLTVALPTSVLRTLGAPAVPAPSRPATPSRPSHFDRVLPMEVELVAELARLRLPLQRVEAFAVGDEFPLGVVGDARVLINDRVSFIGEPGSDGLQRCLKVSRRAAGDDRC